MERTFPEIADENRLIHFPTLYGRAGIRSLTSVTTVVTPSRRCDLDGFLELR